jgi:hypothetical protein
VALVSDTLIGFAHLSGLLDLGCHRFEVTLSPPRSGLVIVSDQVNIAPKRPFCAPGNLSGQENVLS